MLRLCALFFGIPLLQIDLTLPPASPPISPGLQRHPLSPSRGPAASILGSKDIRFQTNTQPSRGRQVWEGRERGEGRQTPKPRPQRPPTNPRRQWRRRRPRRRPRTCRGPRSQAEKRGRERQKEEKERDQGAGLLSEAPLSAVPPEQHAKCKADVHLHEARLSGMQR